MKAEDTVFRVVRRRAKAGCERAYEALIAGMFEQAKRFPGYLSAELVPPEAPGGEYQILQRFAVCGVERHHALIGVLAGLTVLGVQRDGAAARAT